MKYTLRLILLLVIFFYSCGTTGHIIFYDFSTNKYEVESQITSIINKDSAHVIPAKWHEHTTDDYFERIYVYFKGNPEELYQLGFTGDSANWKFSATSRLGLISIYQGVAFKYDSDLSKPEKDRVQKRLEMEILSKINRSYRKND